MGEVFLGHDDALNRTVAIKRVRARAATDETALARFRREARTLAAVDHPGVVSIHTIGTTQTGALYLAMEYVEGIALNTVCTGPWPIAMAAGVVAQAAAALGATHAAGIVHRDVKPDNLLLDTRGLVRVVDFGLARRPDSLTDQVTADNIIIGTVPYMAPEQLMGAGVGAPADVFALGIVLYQLITGVHPFARGSHSATAVAIASVQRPPVRSLRSDLPEPLAQLVDTCLSAEPRYRAQDGTALAAALAPWVTDTLQADLARVVADPAQFIAGLPPTWKPRVAETRPARPRGQVDAKRVDAKRVDATGPTDPPTSAQTTEQSSPLAQGAPIFEQRHRRRWPWIAAALALVIGGGGVAIWPGIGQEGVEPPKAAPAVLAPAVMATGLQTIAILDFDGPEAAIHAVLADRVRVHLDSTPEERLRVVSLTGLQRSVWPQTPIDGRMDTDLLRRNSGSLGAIDFVIRGTVEGQTITLAATSLTNDAASWTAKVALPANDIAAVSAVSVAITERLQLPAPEARPRATSIAGYAAYLAARAAERRNDYGAIDDALTRTFELDPDHVEARCMHMGWLRSVRKTEQILEVAKRLLASDDVTPRQRLFLQANADLATGETVKAVQTLETISRRWPFYVDAQNALLALRFHTRGFKNLAEVERLARRALAFFPRGEHAASRLVRAMAFRGRADEAKTVLLTAGLTPEPRLSNDIWAEVYLYTGEYARADARFTAALKRAPLDMYAKNMRYVARILAGHCADATVGLMGDVTEYEIKGELTHAGWTIRLALQSMSCQRDWAGAEALLARWAKASPEGANVAPAWRARNAMAAGVAPAQVTARIDASLAQAPTPRGQAALFRLRARIDTRPTALSEAAKTSRTAASAPSASPRLRQEWSLTHRMLTLRGRALAGIDDAVLADYARLIVPWDQVRSESQLNLQLEAMAAYAEAAEHAGNDALAQQTWTRIATLKYPRIKGMDLYVKAQAKLAL